MSSEFKEIFWIISALCFVALMFTVAFALTGAVYHVIDWTPPKLVDQIVNSLVGLVLTSLTITMIGRAFESRITDKQMRLFNPIIEALERIAKGDFSVRVDDISEKHSHEKPFVGELVNSVNQMALQLDEMERMRQEFISNVSHEIQSPLTSIRGFAQALRNDALSADERHHYLSIIDSESTRLSRITENLLRLAALESEQAKFEPKCYRLDKQIRNLVLTCEPQWSAKNLEMEVVLEETEITADQDLLSQVWNNLLHNSIKFTPEGGRIVIGTSRQNGNVLFTIQDNGIGILEADQAHIFERFYKVDAARTHTNNGGSGLGLSIVHKIVDMHKGSVSVESQFGAGTTFTVYLPVEPGGTSP